MTGWIVNFAYAMLILAAAPVLVWRAVRQGKYRQGWGDKLWGRLPRTDDGQRIIWLHAVSVGEVLQLRTIVPRLREQRPDCDLLITTTTSTGFAVARETFADCRVSYYPLDFTWAVRAALARVRPVLVVLVELELWPNFIRQTDAAGVPLVLINGRMSSRSYRGYRRIRWWMRPLLARFAGIAVQTDEYAARLLGLGAPPQRLTVSGSIKFDGVRTDRDNAQTMSLRAAFGIGKGERVFIAGSTHEPEEQIALDAYLALREEFHDLRLLLVPRHAERFEEVAAMVASRGVGLVRRSARKGAREGYGDPAHGVRRVGLGGGDRVEWDERPVCLLDTLGELSACWGLADVAFVGGSLTSRGGQNMIEPAAYGAAVIVGPDTHNFRDVVEGLRSCRAITVIGGPNELAPAVRTLLCDPDAAQRQGATSRTFVLAQQGAADRTLQLLTALLPPPLSDAERRAA